MIDEQSFTVAVLEYHAAVRRFRGALHDWQPTPVPASLDAALDAMIAALEQIVADMERDAPRPS